MSRFATAAAIAGTTIAIMAGCASEESADASLSVVATTTILGDLVYNVVGEDAAVEVLIPAGTSPHDFQPSARQAAAIRHADIVVANGLGLEDGLQDVLEAAVADGVRVWEVAPDVDPLPLVEESGAEDSEGGAAGLDPHFWLDPLRVAEATRLLADQLAEVSDGHDWSVRANRYAEELEAVHVDSIERLSVVPEADRKLVTYHRSLGYFADRYGFEMVGTVIPGGTALGNPSSAGLASLVEAIEQDRIPAIFTETDEPDSLAHTVAAEVGHDVVVVELYAGSLSEPGTDGDTLIGILETNARRIAEALGPR